MTTPRNPASATEQWLSLIYDEIGSGSHPTGTIDITQNGTYDVTTYAEADVAVPQPSGTINITQNGSFNVADYATADVVVTFFDWSQIKGGIQFRNVSAQTALDLRNMDTSTFTNMGSMFKDCSSLTSLNVSGLDTSKNTVIGGMFSGCTGLTSLDLSSWNVSRVTSMYQAFNGCSSLATLNLTWVTTSATNMSETFKGCSALTSLDLGSWNTSSVAQMNNTFQNCSSLTSINLEGFTTSNVTSMSNFILGCSSLTDMIWAINSTTVQPLKTAKGWDLATDTVPTNLNIWVRDSLLNDYKTETNCSRYASCFKKISELPQALQELYDIDPSDYQ